VDRIILEHLYCFDWHALTRYTLRCCWSRWPTCRLRLCSSYRSLLVYCTMKHNRMQRLHKQHTSSQSTYVCRPQLHSCSMIWRCFLNSAITCRILNHSSSKMLPNITVRVVSQTYHSVHIAINVIYTLQFCMSIIVQRAT